MGFLSNTIEHRSATYHPKDPALAELWGGGRSNAAGQHVTADTALRTSAVYCCITVLAGTLASMPKNVKKERGDGGKDIIDGHRCHNLLKYRPNKWQSSFEFFEMMEGHRLLRGNAYAQIVFHPGRQKNELVPIHPDFCFPFVITPNGMTYYLSDTSPCPAPGSDLWYQVLQSDGQTKYFTSEEILHVRGYSINGIIGISPIRWAAYQAVGLSMAAEDHGARLFSNGAQLSKVVKHPKKLGQLAYDRLKEQFNPGGEYVGSPNAHKTLILEENMDVVKIGMTAEESQFLETRKFQVEDIFRIYRVPLMLGAAGDKAPTFASAEQFLTLYKAVTMHENVCRWEQAMDRDLLYPSEIGQYCIDIDMDSLVRGDIVARATYLKERFGMASMSPDQIRLYEGENPTGTEEGKKFYLTSGMMPASMAGVEPIKEETL